MRFTPVDWFKANAPFGTVFLKGNTAPSRTVPLIRQCVTPSEAAVHRRVLASGLPVDLAAVPAALRDAWLMTWG